MGALCCVAARPQGAKSPADGRDSSNSRGEPHWRINSSISPPPPLRMWDCRLQSDGLPQISHGARGLPLLSSSRGSRSWMGSERYTNHQHSVSDGALSYPDSPRDNFQEKHWTSPVPKFNLGELATSNVQGSRLQRFPYSTERRLTVRASPHFGSLSSTSESSQQESSSKRPYAFPTQNASNRRSHMSKAVYPLMYRSPVLDYETFGDAETSGNGNSRLTLSKDMSLPSIWRDNRLSSEYKSHRALMELNQLETLSDPNTSSRREGFRWSNASSYDRGFDMDRFDIVDVEMDSLRSPNGLITDHKCGVCGKLLWQKSPWSSHRIMRGSDMPTAGVLPCSHVFHAECLEQVTPKAQVHDPPCPSCSKAIVSVEESPPVSEPLQVALRSIQKGKGVVILEAEGSDDKHKATFHHGKNRLRESWMRGVSEWHGKDASITSRLKRHFPFKGKGSKETSGSKLSHIIGLPSANEPFR